MGTVSDASAKSGAFSTHSPNSERPLVHSSPSIPKTPSASLKEPHSYAACLATAFLPTRNSISIPSFSSPLKNFWKIVCRPRFTSKAWPNRFITLVLIRQRHIRVGSQLVNVPSFNVRTSSEKHIDFATNSPYGQGPPGRVAKKLAASRAAGADDEE